MRRFATIAIPENAIGMVVYAALLTAILVLGLNARTAAARQSATPVQLESDRGSVSGAVIDEAGVELQAATAVVYAASDSALVVGAATDAEGRFLFDNVSAGRYWLRVSFIGFSDYDSEVFELTNGQAFNMPRVTLKSDALALDGVEVEGERALVEVQPDKTVLNVQGTANAAGSDAMELLKKAPGVVVDNNDNIILSGKNGVKI